MSKIIVQYLDPNKGPQADSFDGDGVQFMTEPSGALVVFKKPGQPWAAFASGGWWKVDIDG